MKILNLYAGIGGNRALWGDAHEITAVENDPEIARAYEERFPQDDVFICDAHEYLIDYFTNFDFIWSSPPCPTHGQYRFNVGVKAKGYAPVYPDMKLYEEIIFLKHHFEGLWLVENVKPYYEPLIKPTTILQRHLFWSNFEIADFKLPASGLRTKNKISDFDDADFVLGTGIKNKMEVLKEVSCFIN